VDIRILELIKLIFCRFSCVINDGPYTLLYIHFISPNIGSNNTEGFLHLFATSWCIADDLVAPDIQQLLLENDTRQTIKLIN